MSKRGFWLRFLACLLFVSGPAHAQTQEMIFPGKDWAEATPESQGLDSAKLRAAAKFLEENAGSDGARELVIVRNGRLVWKGDHIDKRHGVWSCTKSFTSTMLGLLIADGQCTLDTRAAEFVPELKALYPDVTLRHLTTMTSGYRAVGDETTGSYKHGPSSTPFAPNPQPLFTPPGSQYAYWDSAMNLFGLVLTRIAGEPMEGLFRRRVAEPIGMKDWDWGDYSTDHGVVVNGGSGNANKHISITAREMARFGHLLLNKGRWNGKQLIPAEWVEQATLVHVPASTPWAHPESDIDGRGCYGFNWWVNGVKAGGKRLWPGAPAGTFAASGHNNNKCFVIPEWNMVIVRLGLDQRDRKINDQVWSAFIAKVGEAIMRAPEAENAAPTTNGRSLTGAATGAADYFPPPESQGGWRKLEKAEDIRRLAGMDPEKLASLREWLLKSDDRNFAAVVIRRGYIVLEVERGNSAVTDSRRVASVSKAVCATVLAIASEQSRQGKTPRKMTFDDPAFDFIPWAQPLSDPRKAQIKVKQLLNHTSGICPEATGAKNDGTWEYVLGHTGDPNTARLAFDPGAACGYSSHALHHASLVCETVTGRPYDQFAIEALFKPIGCERWWFQFYDGDEKHGRHPSHGLGMPARDLARIAYCMLRGGRWKDQQVIPKWFVDETAAPTHDVKSPEMRWKLNPQIFSHGWELPARLTGEGGRSGEGIPADARHKPGSGGQLIAFVPSLDLVITRQTGGSGQWEYEEYLRRACAAVLPVKPAEAPRPPYPPSPVIERVEFDWTTHKRFAPGSDNWPVTWADDDHLYSAWGDGGGFGGSNSKGRVSLGVARIEGDATNYTGKNVWGGFEAEHPAQFDGKSYGLLSVDGTLYLWVSHQPNPHLGECQLAVSRDHGATWRKADWSFRFADQLTVPTFLNFGQDHRGARDDYVYSYYIHPAWGPGRSPTGNYGFDVHRPGKVYLSRTPKGAVLDRSRYEFFAGMGGDGKPLWSAKLADKQPVFTDANGVGWNLSVSYNPGLRRYLLCTEHGETHAGKFGLFDAPEPWGPWTTVAYDESWGAGHVEASAFYWNFANKWASPDGTRFTLIFTGKNSNDSWNTVNGRFERRTGR